MPGPVSALPAAVALAPCAGQGKDCTDITYTVPEPGALALVALGLGALAAHRSKS